MTCPTCGLEIETRYGHRCEPFGHPAGSGQPDQDPDHPDRDDTWRYGTSRQPVTVPAPHGTVRHSSNRLVDERYVTVEDGAA